MRSGEAAKGGGTRPQSHCSHVPMNDSEPPFIIRLTAALLIVFGAGALVDIAASLFLHGKLSLNLGFAGIPIGRGLLMSRQSSRYSALILCGLALILTPGLVAWMGFSGKFRAFTHEQLWVSGIHVAITILICATVFFGLRSASARAWPWSDFGNQEQGQAWTTPLILIGVLFATLSALSDFRTEAAFRGLFPVQTYFEFRDASTGSRIKSVRFSSDGMSITSGRRDPLAPRISTSFISSSHDAGHAVEITGFSGRPFNITFTSAGYRPITYTLNSKSPREVMLNFQAP